MTKGTDASDSTAQEGSEQAARHTLALNPLVGMRGKDLADGAGVVLKALLKEPMVATDRWLSFVGELGKIIAGDSNRAPETGDKRFADATWKNSALHRGLLQAYLAWGDAVNKFIDQTGLSDLDKRRAHLFANIAIDVVAPTNNFLSNPAALRQFLDTGGQSAWRGFRHFLDDLANNGGLPSQVDKSGFKVGGNLATTPGAVVFRNELLELIQYSPMAPTVRKRPIVYTPPQINKFYSLDLSPDKSLVQFLLKNGFQIFAVSWRNPTADQRDWGLDTYVAALDQATDAVIQITGSDDVTMLGPCSGGITASAYLGYLAAKEQPKIKNLSLLVCLLDLTTEFDSPLASLVTPETMTAAKEASRHRGVLDGQELARVFAWMRPNDLIWNYWVNNYLLGNNPPAFDILFWNADTTCLPARLHSDYIDLYFTNPFVNANKMSLNGASIDMSRVKADVYVVAGTTDHITPWKAVYRSARIYGDDATFVLSNSGHLQSLLNPPTNPKASFVTALAQAPDAAAFLAGGEKKTGSWWPHWRDWLNERSGEEVPAPLTLGSERHPAGVAAPGTYVFD
jgi:polyhydroxyalkanoate synthase subunit PhaC